MAEWTNSASSSDPIANTDDESDQCVRSSILLTSSVVDRSSVRSSINQHSSHNSKNMQQKYANTNNSSININTNSHINASELKQSLNCRIDHSHHSDDEQHLIRYMEAKQINKINDNSIALTPISSRSVSVSRASMSRKTKSDERNIKTSNSPNRTTVKPESSPSPQTSHCCLLM